MPEELLTFPPAYCVVGAFRLARDPLLWKPMWKKTSAAAKRGGMIAAAWAIFTWPIQKLFVRYFMSGTAAVTGLSSRYSSTIATADSFDGRQDSRFLGIFGMPSLTTFAALVFVLGQCNTIMEFWMRKKLKECRNEAYAATVLSRGKGDNWWTPYTEEWQEPPLAKAQKNAKKQAFYMRLATPIVRIFFLKVVLLPLDFIPFLGLIVSCGIRSLSMGRQLHAPLFAHKRMTPTQVELWVTERQFEYRTFGLAAALLETLPVMGLALSISNRVGAAMYAHDLEKRQQSFRDGRRKPLPRDQTYSLVDPRRPSSPTSSQRGKLPFAPQGEEDFSMPGATPSKLASSSSRIKPATETIDEPPAYTIAEAEDVQNNAGDSLGSGMTKRRVPPLPQK